MCADRFAFLRVPRSLPHVAITARVGRLFGRRRFLAAGAAIPALAGMSLSHVSAQEPKAAAGKADPNEKWGIPGPYPGRVIEVRNPRMIKNDVKDRDGDSSAVDAGHEGADRRHRRRSRPGGASSSRATSSASR